MWAPPPTPPTPQVGMCVPGFSSYHLEGPALTTVPVSGPSLACHRDIYKDINLVTATLISDSHFQSGRKDQKEGSDPHLSEPPGRNSLHATGLWGIPRDKV